MQSNRWGLFFTTMLLTLMQGFTLMFLYNRGQQEFISSVIGTSAYWAIYIFAELKYNFAVPTFIRAAVVIAIGSDSFLGTALDWYNTMPVYDRIQHVFGTYAVALFTLVLVLRSTKLRLPAALAVILTFSLGMTLGAINEISEYFIDTYGHPPVPNQPSLEDTDLDLVSNTVGAILAACHHYLANYGGGKAREN